MACLLFSLQSGDFINRGWGTDSQFGWSLERVVANDLSFYYKLKRGNQVKGTITFDGPSNEVSAMWIFYGNGNFLAIYGSRYQNPRSLTVKICDLRGLAQAATSTNQIPLYELHYNLTLDKTLFFAESQGDGKACFLHILVNGGNESHSHVVYRSDKLVTLCSYGDIGSPSQPVPGIRLARYNNATRTVQIFVTSIHQTIYATRALPQGFSELQSDAQDFGEVVVGPRSAQSSTYRQFTINNTGLDTLEINSIQPSGPFSVDPPLPAPTCIPADGILDITVKFEPTQIGNFNTDLTVDLTPNRGDKTLHCTGTARLPIPKLAVMLLGNLLNFGTVVAGIRKELSVPVSNNGDARLIFLCRIQGRDKSSFGLELDPPNASATNVVSERYYEVNAKNPNDGSTRGSGRANVKVVFYARGNARTAKAELRFYGVNSAGHNWNSRDRSPIQMIELYRLHLEGRIVTIGRIGRPS